MLSAILAFIVSLLVALVLVPMLFAPAKRFGLIDKPDNKRKLHKSAIPMIGGLAIFVTCSLVAGILLLFGSQQTGINYVKFRPNDLLEIVALFGASAFLLVVGVADDLLNIRGRQKLLGQIVASTILILAGYYFSEVYFAGTSIKFGIFSIVVVYMWMLAATNSINLLDGADGFASTIGVIMSLALAAMAVHQGKYIDAVIAFSLAGAILGFLRYNFPPAKAFLGDSGSMLIGFMLGALAIRCTFKQTAAYAFFAPVAILAIPFIDTTAAIIRRRLTGRSIYEVDRGHLHHQFAKQGFSPRISLLWVALLCATTAVGGVLALINRQSEYAIVSIAIVVIVLFVGRIFGVAEFQLMSNKVVSLSKSFLRVSSRKESSIHQTAIHVQGVHDWQHVWEDMCKFAQKRELHQLTMDLNVPWIHESFHATRRLSGKKNDAEKEWYAEIPIIVDGRISGRVEVLGGRSVKYTHQQVINDLLVVTSEIETGLAHLEADSAELENPYQNSESEIETDSTVEPESESTDVNPVRKIG